MEVIAKTNGTGFLIQATETEIKEIINAVTGSKPKEVEIGQKLPAIDYAATIRKIKTLKDEYHFKEMVEKQRRVSDAVSEMVQAVEKAALIE